MNELELLEQINKNTSVSAIFTGLLLLIVICIAVTKFLNNFDIVYKGDEKKK